MSAESNKALVQKIFARIWDKGEMSAVDELFDANYVDHTERPPGTPAGLEGFKAVIMQIRKAFPDMKSTLQDMIVEGDKVVGRWTNESTNTGEFMGMPPTGKKVTTSGIDIYRISGGKIIEGWGVVDMMSVMQQLGVDPGHPEGSGQTP
jgi:steroid delta-isomerase-like uncharacterized protein